MNCGTMLTCCPLKKVIKIVMSIDLKIRLMLMTTFSYGTHKSPDHFGCWVVEIFKGDENEIRSANVKRDGSTQKYSINHLYPLELQQLLNESILPCNNVHEAPPVGHLPVETVRRSARLMAQRAKSQ